jgi:hypothetical protein
MRILCIAAPSKDGTSKVYKIDKDLEELKSLSSKHPLSWIVKGIENKISPNSEKLGACNFHSFCNASVKNDVEFCYKESQKFPNTKYAIFTDDYICYDLCEHIGEVSRKKELEDYKYNSDILHNLPSYFSSRMENYSYFKKVFKERSDLFIEKTNLDNPLKAKSVKYEREKLDIMISNLTERLQKNYTTSYKDILVLRRDLENLIPFCMRFRDFRDYIVRINSCIHTCNENLKIFKEFKGDDNDEYVLKIIDFYAKVDKKKQESVEKEEKRYKEKINQVSVASNSVIVKADGTVIEDKSEGPKMVIGKVIESKAELEAEKQERLARNTTYL